METIIKKAINGGWKENLQLILNARNFSERQAYFMRADFWQALGKSCGWSKKENNPTWLCPICMASLDEKAVQIDEKSLGIETWRFNALRFHEINLTEGWDKAVKYLEDLTH